MMRSVLGQLRKHQPVVNQQGLRPVDTRRVRVLRARNFELSIGRLKMLGHARGRNNDRILLQFDHSQGVKKRSVNWNEGLIAVSYHKISCKYY